MVLRYSIFVIVWISLGYAPINGNVDRFQGSVNFISVWFLNAIVEFSAAFQALYDCQGTGMVDEVTAWNISVRQPEPPS